VLTLTGAVVAACAGSTPRAGPAHPATGFDAARTQLVASLRSASSLTLPPLPTDCIPAAAGAQPQLGAYATFSGSLTINNSYGQVANATISGSICGVATVINRPPSMCTSPPGQSASVQLNIPADGEQFNLPGVNVTLVPGLSIPISHITIVPTAITAVVCAVAAPGPITQVVTATIPAGATTFGATCYLTVTVPLRAEIYGPLGNFQIIGSNLPFVIPPATPSPTCPANLTGALNKLLALPLAQPAGEISISGTGMAYQP
jgi:hypothetical protein